EAALAGALLLIPLAVGRPLSDMGLAQALDLLAAKLLVGGGVVVGIAAFVLAAQPLPPGAARHRAPARQPARPVVQPLPPGDMSADKKGRCVRAWAAEGGLPAPLPPDSSAAAPAEPDDLVDLLMQTAGAPGAAVGQPAFAAGDNVPAASVLVVPPERDIAI